MKIVAITIIVIVLMIIVTRSIVINIVPLTEFFL